MEWLVENAALVANLASLATLVVWTFYLVLFYREFQRQRTPFLVIHQARGHGLDATALVVNLSKEPVHVLRAMLVLHTARGTFVQQLHDFRRTPRESDPREVEVRVVALHGAHSRPVGAARTFRVHAEGDRIAVEPAILLTRQLTARSDRRVVDGWLQDCLPRRIP